jgi:hypothetical protein
MEYVHKFTSLTKQERPVAPLPVTLVRPGIWERLKTTVKATYSTELFMELVFGVSTFLLTVGLFIGLARGLAHYTIIPMP